jgi:hypothetical protein
MVTAQHLSRVMYEHVRQALSFVSSNLPPHLKHYADNSWDTFFNNPQKRNIKTRADKLAMVAREKGGKFLKSLSTCLSGYLDPTKYQTNIVPETMVPLQKGCFFYYGKSLFDMRCEQYTKEYPHEGYGPGTIVKYK